MIIGKGYDVDGFDTLASMQSAEGNMETRVVHNSSTHVHVFDMNSFLTGDGRFGVLLASFTYNERIETFRLAYAKALAVALSHTLTT
jgi:hypothetical protein